MTAPVESTLQGVLAAVDTAVLAALTNASMEVGDAELLGGPTHTAPVVDYADNNGDLCRYGIWIESIDARALGERRPDAAGQIQKPGIHTTAALRVEYWRPFPNVRDAGSPPDPDDVAAATYRLHRGAFAIWCELINRRNAGTLFATDALALARIGRGDIAIGSLRPLPPSGYTAGWQMSLEVGLPALLESSG